MFATADRKRLLVGLLLLVVIMGTFLAFNRLPKIGIVGEDLDAVTAPGQQCFQGFCIDRDPGTSFLTRWIKFSVSYLRLVTIGMTFAFITAGLAESFLFSRSVGRGLPTAGVFRRTVQGTLAGGMMNLCSACIVPVSSAFHKRASIEGAIAMVQGSTTLNIPALAMVFFVFRPILGFSRLIFAIVGALIIGPIVVLSVRRNRAQPVGIPDMSQDPADLLGWRQVLLPAFRQWAKSSFGYAIRLSPIMIFAGFASDLSHGQGGGDVVRGVGRFFGEVSVVVVEVANEGPVGEGGQVGGGAELGADDDRAVLVDRHGGGGLTGNGRGGGVIGAEAGGQRVDEAAFGLVYGLLGEVGVFEFVGPVGQFFGE